MDRTRTAMTLSEIGYAAAAGRLKARHITAARQEIEVALAGDGHAEARRMFLSYLDRLEENLVEERAQFDIAADLRQAVRRWYRPDPVDAERRDIYG